MISPETPVINHENDVEGLIKKANVLDFTNIIDDLSLVNNTMDGYDIDIKLAESLKQFVEAHRPQYEIFTQSDLAVAAKELEDQNIKAVTRISSWSSDPERKSETRFYLPDHKEENLTLRGETIVVYQAEVLDDGGTLIFDPRIIRPLPFPKADSEIIEGLVVSELGAQEKLVDLPEPIVVQKLSKTTEEDQRVLVGFESEMKEKGFRGLIRKVLGK